MFVGYGIDAPEYGWNDYAGIDMHGKTALILVNDPGFVTGEEALFRGKAMTYHGRWTYKFEEAARQGAAAAIIVHETAPASYDWGVVQEQLVGPAVLPRPRRRQFRPHGARGLDHRGARAPAHGARRPGLRRAEGGGGEARLQAAFRSASPRRGGVRNVVRHKRSPNIVGSMAGKDRPDEYVIYMAHWDHLGLDDNPEGDRVYNGAVDNATGVAGILTIARAYRDMLPGASRSVLFIAVTAEESGLLGSEYYVEHPLVPLAKTAALINIDALHPLGRAKDVEVVGYGASDLEDLLADGRESQGRTLTPDQRSEAGRFYRSDQFNFAKAGVPSLYIKSGTTCATGRRARARRCWRTTKRSATTSPATNTPSPGTSAARSRTCASCSKSARALPTRRPGRNGARATSSAPCARRARSAAKPREE